jgi:hypothetical protein
MRVAEIREQMATDDEASLWTMFFDDPEGEPAMASVIHRAMDKIDLEVTRRFARVTRGVGATSVLFAVVRRDGQPRPEDRRLWLDLQSFLCDSGSEVRAFLVVGATSYWCAPGGDAPAAA